MGFIRRALLLAVALSLLAGCGGGGSAKPLSKTEYQKAVKSIVASFSFQSVTGSSSKKLADGQQAIRGVADRLDRLRPPQEVAAAHRDLVAGLRQFADDLGTLDARVREAKKSKNPYAVLGVLARLKSFQTLERAQKEFQAKGYKLGLSGNTG